MPSWWGGEVLLLETNSPIPHLLRLGQAFLESTCHPLSYYYYLLLFFLWNSFQFLREDS